MKKIILSICMMLISLSYAFSQDKILTKDSIEISGKVIEINSTDIKYRPQGAAANTPLTIIPRSSVISIEYKNGIVEENFDDEDEKLIPEDVAINGMQDAEKYYDGYHEAAVGTYVVTVLTGPILGLIPAVATSTTPPPLENLYLAKELQENPEYVAGYMEGAKKKKSRKVWRNYGLGVATDVAIAIVAVVAATTLINY